MASIITTVDNFNNYLIKDGMLANASNTNKPILQLKLELSEILTNLSSLSASTQTLNKPSALSVSAKTLTLKKGDGSTENVTFDLFDTKVNKTTSVDNRIVRFDGVNGEVQNSTATIDDLGNLTITGSITSKTGVINGNCSTATKLQTPRLIGGVSFDGTSNISLPGVNSAGNQNTSGNAATATTADRLSTGNMFFLVGDVNGESRLAFDGSTFSIIDTSFNFTQNITLSGDVTGSAINVNNDDIKIITTIANDSHTHDTRYWTKEQCDSYYVNMSGDVLAGPLRPSFNNGIDLGTSTFKWGHVYTTYVNSSAADIAEKYISDKEYEVGTVCEVGGSKEITLYNNGPLAGVISGNAAFRLNEESEGQYIALKGKVPVKCEGDVKKAQYCLAIPGGKVKGVDYFDANFTLKIVGVALEDSKDGFVMVKV